MEWKTFAGSIERNSKPTTMFALSQASASLDVVTPLSDAVIRVFASESAFTQELKASSGSGQNSASGSTATACFDSQGSGYLSARVLSDASQVALQWFSNSTNKHSESPLARSTALPAVVCQFPAPLAPKCLLLLRDDTLEVIYLVAVTTNGFIYRLALPAPLYCYADAQLVEASATQHPLVYLCDSNKQAISLQALHEDAVLLSLDDGTLLKCEQARLDDLSRRDSKRTHDDSWQETALSYQSSWSLFPHVHNAHDTVVSTASLCGQRDILDVAFTLSRNKTIKIWSLPKQRLIKSFDLSQLVSCFTSTDLQLRDAQSTSAKGSSAAAALFPSMALPYLHVFHTDAISSDFAAFLALFAPQSQSFLFFGIDVDDAGQVSQLVPILQKPIKAGFAAELIDFKVSRVDRQALAGLGSKFDDGEEMEGEGDGHHWTLWSLWAVGKQSQMALVELPELETASSTSSAATFDTDWVPLVRPAAQDSLNPPNALDLEHLPQDLINDMDAAVDIVNAQYLDHLFLPCRYSFSLLEGVLDMFIETSDVNTPEDSHMPLREAIAAVVSSTVQLRTSTQTGANLVAEYLKDLDQEWMRFTAIANEFKHDAGYPLALCIQESDASVLCVERDAVTVPVLQSEATLLRLQVVDPSTTSDAFLALPEDQLADSYPNLAQPAVRETMAILCRSARTLFLASQPSQLERDILGLACTPPTTTLAEAASDLYDQSIATTALADPTKREQLLAQLAALPMLSEAFDSLLVLLLSPKPHGFPSGRTSSSSDSSCLSLALLTASTMDLIESRYAIALELLALLCTVQAEQDDLLPNIDLLFCRLLSAFHALYNLRWVSQSAVVPLVSQVSMDREDSLTEGLGALTFTHTSQITPSTPLEPFSLLNALMRYSNDSPSLPVLPSSVAINQAVCAFLESTRLLDGSKASAEPEVGDALFAMRLFSLGCHQEVLFFVDTFASDPLLEYVRGRACLQLGQVTEARDAFEVAASDAASIGRALHVFNSSSQYLASYYRHVADLFFSHDVREPVYAFCSLAVTSGLDKESESVQREVWLRLFQSANETSLFHDAYSALVQIPFPDLKHECLRQLVSAMCDQGQSSKLLALPFAGMKEELERQLEFRAWNSDPRATPSYPCLLYSLLVSRGDYRKAAATMYTHARRLGQVDLRRNDFDQVATLRCQAYLAAISSLTLVGPRHQWISSQHAFRSTSGKQKAAVYDDAPLAHETPLILSISDIRKEYTQALARLELVAYLPSLSASVRDLSPDMIVALYAQNGLYEKALSSAHVLGVDMAPLFEALARKCVRLGQVEGSQAYSDTDASWVFEDASSQTKSGSLSSKAWLLLFKYLEEYDHDSGCLYESVADVVLELEEDLPAPLVGYFKMSNPAILARLLLKHGELNLAMRFALGVVRRNSQQRTGSKMDALPWTVLDVLITSGDEIINLDMQQQLQEDVQKYLQGAAKVPKALR